MVIWRECANPYHNTRYLPSATSDPEYCGICAPLKRKSVVRIVPCRDDGTLVEDRGDEKAT